ncbi:MAG: glycosyltransferase family 39 protein [Flavobacteriales bacterium]|jgi:4-amino-4-deoxy-L-arabinose transferase-like glycosyltransferase|nr:glycosyltransferase family 39 protein [Flavobacteriales bacterium]
MRNLRNLKTILLFITIFLIAFISKYQYIDTRDICVDEPFTIFMAQNNWLDILKLPISGEPNPPLFILLLHFWMKIFGNDVEVIRSLPLIFNALTAGVIFLVGKHLRNSWTGIIASLVFIYSTLHFYFGMETRAYSMLSFGTSLSLLSYLKLIANDHYQHRKKWTFILIASNFLILYSHYFGLFMIGTQFLLSFMFWKDKKLFWTLIKSLVITGILFLPMVIVFYEHFIHFTGGTVLSPPKNKDYLYLLRDFTNNNHTLNWMTYILLSSLICGIVLFKLKIVKLDKTVGFIFLWWLIPYFAMFAISFKMPMFYARYLLFTSIGFYLSLVYLIFKSFHFKLINIFVGFLMVILFYRSLEINSKQFFYREVKNAVEKVKELQNKNDNSLVLIHPHWAFIGFSYYYDKEIFQSLDSCEAHLNKADILPIYGWKGVKRHLQKTNKEYDHIIYYQDGSLFIDPENSIYHKILQEHQQTDSVFYPECFTVTAFKESSKQ